MARHILQPRDAVMFRGVDASLLQKSTDQTNFGSPVEFSQYNCVAYQVWWNGIDGTGIFKLQTSLKPDPNEADWVDKIGGEIETNGSDGTDINVVSYVGEKSIRLVWVPNGTTMGTISADLMGKDSSGPISYTKDHPLEVTASFTGLRNGGKITPVEVVDFEWRPLPSVPLANRNALTIQNISGTYIKINYADDIVGFVGVQIASGMERFYDLTDEIVMYAKSATGTVTILVEELS